MTAVRDLACQRYIELVCALGERYGHEYGWMSKVAQELGIAPSYVAKLFGAAKHDSALPRSIGVAVVDRAIERLGIPASWFSDPELTTESLRLPPRGVIRAGQRSAAASETEVRLAMVAAAVGLGSDAAPRDVLVRVIDLVMEARDR